MSDDKNDKPQWENLDGIPIAKKLADRFRALKSLLEEEKERLEDVIAEKEKGSPDG